MQDSLLISRQFLQKKHNFNWSYSYLQRTLQIRHWFECEIIWKLLAVSRPSSRAQQINAKEIYIDVVPALALTSNELFMDFAGWSSVVPEGLGTTSPPIRSPCICDWLKYRAQQKNRCCAGTGSNVKYYNLFVRARHCLPKLTAC